MASGVEPSDTPAGERVYLPDRVQLEPYEDILDALAKTPLEPQARTDLAGAAVDGYIGAMFERASFAVSRAAREVDALGVLEVTVALQVLGTLAEGIAI